MINVTTKIIQDKRKYDHVTPLLHDLPWLCIRQRIDCKISTLIFESLLHVTRRHTSLSSVPRILPGKARVRSAARGSLAKLSAPCVTLDGRSVDAVGLQIWKRVPSITNPDLAWFHFSLKLSFSCKVTLNIGVVLKFSLGICHCSQTRNYYHYRYMQRLTN